MKGPLMHRLGDFVASVEKWNPAHRTETNTFFTYIDIAAVNQETKTIDSPQTLKIVDAPSRARQIVQTNDVLVSTVRPNLNAVASVPESLNGAIASTGFTVLRPISDMLDSRYLHHLTRSKVFIEYLVSRATGASYPAVSDGIVKDAFIHIPSFDEQRRIAAILDKADAIRRKRQQALALADDFLRSTFLEMFGDPVTNSNGLTSAPLGTVAEFISGGTPSKNRSDYWNGTFPWVSPKDMKREQIDSAEDGVSDAVFSETSLKKLPKRTVLIVVRGMILAHTVPIAISMVPLTINQDMKGIKFKPNVIPEFGLWCLRVQHAHMLTKIDTAAHGTKKFDLKKLKSLPILIPDMIDQEKFAKFYITFHQLRKRSIILSTNADTLFTSLSQRAFLGEL